MFLVFMHAGAKAKLHIETALQQPNSIYKCAEPAEWSNDDWKAAELTDIAKFLLREALDGKFVPDSSLTPLAALC